MSNNVKDILLDIIYMKNFNPNNIKKYQKLHKNILIYYIGYVTIKRI